ncbi:MAG: hypothetical protein JWN38_1265 [Candidatus Saccharibacteria bacterium]|nr:hypothetical protein [Candidatus Saccharibacteria bacterium]
MNCHLKFKRHLREGAEYWERGTKSGFACARPGCNGSFFVWTTNEPIGAPQEHYDKYDRRDYECEQAATQQEINTLRERITELECELEAQRSQS